MPWGDNAVLLIARRRDESGQMRHDIATGLLVLAITACRPGGAVEAAEAPRIEISQTRFGYSEQHRASFVTVSVRNATSRDLGVLTVACRFLRPDGRSDMTVVLFRDLPAGGEAQGFTYAHSSIPAVEVECTKSGVRY